MKLRRTRRGRKPRQTDRGGERGREKERERRKIYVCVRDEKKIKKMREERENE